MTPDQLRELIELARRSDRSESLIDIAPLLLELWEAAEEALGGARTMQPKNPEARRLAVQLDAALTALEQA